MMASTLLSRIAVPTLEGSNCTTLILSGAFGCWAASPLSIATLSGAMPYWRRMTLSRSMLLGARPTTPNRRPTSSSILVIASGLAGSVLAAEDLAAGAPFFAADFLAVSFLAAAFFAAGFLAGSSSSSSSSFAAFFFAAGLLVSDALPFESGAEGTMNTTTFLRRIATTWPSFGIPVSWRTTARSAGAVVERGHRFAGSAGHDDRLQTEIGAIAQQLRRDRVNHPDVLAVRRTDRDGQLGRQRADIERGGCEARAQQDGRGNDQPHVFAGRP